MRPGKRSTASPARLTLLAGGAQHVWIKLQWEAAGLRRAREAQPFDLISTIYGAINFAITVQSLEDWTAKARVARDRSKGGGRVAHAKEIEEAVPMQAAFRDIANTAKHAHHREDNWLGGKVEIVQTPAFVGTSREYVLVYHGDNGRTHTSLDLFDQVTKQWLQLLTRWNLIGLAGMPVGDGVAIIKGEG